VSDAWTIPDKWKRMAIAAAGMYVELFLASIAAFVWWFTHPGLINQLALNAIFVCSVSTLLFNANPLMKYDGYYILSDWLEIPNLRQKSATLLQRAVSQIGLGMEVLHDPFLPQRRRWLFASYSMASAIYRCFVTVSIFFFFYKVLEPYGFKVIGQILALLMIVGIALPPLVQVVRLFSIPGRLGQVKTSRALLTAALLSGLVLGALAIPLPHHVRCGLYVQPAHSATMYVKAPGRVRTLLAQPNQWVNAGDPVMELENSDLQMDLADLSGQNEVARKALQFAVRISHEDAKFAGDVETAEARLASVTTLASQRQRDLENLIIRAPISGVLVAADYVAPADDDDGNLGRWYGRVLEPRNIGSFVHEGTNVGQIVPDPTKLEAVLAIDQGDIEFIGKGQAVEMWIRECPTRTFRSQLSEVSCAQMKAVPRCLSQKFGGDLNTTTAADKSERPASTTYRVAVPLDDAQGTLLVGSSGKAKVRVGYRTIGQWLWRMICQTVRFEL
jgi:putative peptide zinc metalloprotease protein